MYDSCFFLFFSFFILCLKRFKTRLKRLFKTCFLLTHNPNYILYGTFSLNSLKIQIIKHNFYMCYIVSICITINI